MTIYYVSRQVGASDSNPGTSPDFPWSNISKVNASTFSSSDIILFRAGDSWLDANGLIPPAPGLTISRYGVGARPVIRYDGTVPGSSIATSWSAVGAATYFGNNVPVAGFSSGFPSGTFGNKNLAFTCPGPVGSTQTLVELSGFAYSDNSDGISRMAIYRASDRSLIAQGSSVFTVTSGITSTATWFGHLTQASMTPNPATLVGGTNYLVMVTWPGAGDVVHIGSDTVASGQAGAVFSSYTNGFPDPLGAEADSTVLFHIRAGIQGSSVYTTPLAFPAGFGPMRLFLNDVEYLPASAGTLVDATNRWFWGSDVLWVYSFGTNPASGYSSVVAGTLKKGSWAQDSTDYDGPLHITKDNLTISGLDLRGGWTSIDPNGAKNVDVSDCAFGLFSVYGADYRGANVGVNIHHSLYNSGFNFPSDLTDRTGDGIRLHAISGNHVRCKVYNNTIQDAPHTGVALTSIFAPYSVTDCEVFNNEITGFHVNYGRGVGFTSLFLNNVTRNSCYSNSMHDLRTYALAVEGNGNKYYRNLIYNVTNSSVPLYNGYCGGMDLSFNPNKICQNEEIYHNTVCNVGADGLFLQADATHPCSGHTIANNIFMNWGQQFSSYAIHSLDTYVQGNTFKNNCYLKGSLNTVINWAGSDYTVGRFESNTPGGGTASGNTNIDPQFVDNNNDFHLRSTSPLIDRALTVNGINDTNYVGRGPDIGLYEYSGALQNTVYLASVQPRGPIGLTSQFTGSGGTITVGPNNTAEVQFAVPTKLAMANTPSWGTGDCVVAAPLVSNISSGLLWNSYASSNRTIVLRVANMSASTATVASSVIWSFMGFARIS